MTFGGVLCVGFLNVWCCLVLPRQKCRVPATGLIHSCCCSRPCVYLFFPPYYYSACTPPWLPPFHLSMLPWCTPVSFVCPISCSIRDAKHVQPTCRKNCGSFILVSLTSKQPEAENPKQPPTNSHPRRADQPQVHRFLAGEGGVRAPLGRAERGRGGGGVAFARARALPSGEFQLGM